MCSKFFQIDLLLIESVFHYVMDPVAVTAICFNKIQTETMKRCATVRLELRGLRCKGQKCTFLCIFNVFFQHTNYLPAQCLYVLVTDLWAADGEKSLLTC